MTQQVALQYTYAAVLLTAAAQLAKASITEKCKRMFIAYRLAMRLQLRDIPIYIGILWWIALLISLLVQRISIVIYLSIYSVNVTAMSCLSFELSQ